MLLHDVKFRQTLKTGCLKYIVAFFIFILYPFLLSADTYLTGITVGFLCVLMVASGWMALLVGKVIVPVNRADIIFVLFVIVYAGRILLARGAADGSVVIGAFTVALVYFYFRAVKIPFFFLLFCAGLIQGGWYMLQVGEILTSHHYLFAGTGCFPNPAILGLFLVLAFLAGAAGYDLKWNRMVQVLWGAALLFLLACVVAVGSRASFVALVAGGVWMLPVLPGGKRLGRWFAGRRKYGLILSAAALFLGLYGLYLLRPVSVQGRFLIWQVICEQIPASPWWGQGELAAHYMPMQAVWFAGHPDSDLVQVAGNNIYAFNEFLRVTSETGIIGLLLFVGLLSVGLLRSYRGDRVSRCAGGILFAVVCFGLFSYPLSVEWIVLIAVVALAVAMTGEERVSVTETGSALRYGGMMIVLMLVVAAGEEYVAEKRADQLLRAAQHDRTVTGSAAMQHFRGRLCRHPDFMSCYAKTLFNDGCYREVLPVLEQASRLRPTSDMLCDLGTCCLHSGDTVRAVQIYTLAADMVPSRVVPRYRLFSLYRDADNRDAAAGEARRLITMPVKVVNTSVLRYRNQARIFLKENNLLSK